MAKPKTLPSALVTHSAVKNLSRYPDLPVAVEFLGKFDGVLYVGDPHASPLAIGRRQDNYFESCMSKLEFARDLANKHNLLVICLGDLFHRQGTNSLRLLNRMTRIFKGTHAKWLVLDGNHDRTDAVLNDDCALTLLDNAGTVRVPPNVGLNYQAEVAGKMVDLHFFPHGVQLPDQVVPSDNIAIAITHHDLAFGNPYPGAIALKPIMGIDKVVNGHMHDTKDTELHGATWWHNPGNIEPLSLDLEHFVPKVWRWEPSMGVDALEGIVLPHGTDLFNKDDKLVEAGDVTEAVHELTISEFATGMKRDETEQAARTNDASVFKEDVGEVLSLSSASQDAKNLVAFLAQAVQTQAEDAAQSGELVTA